MLSVSCKTCPSVVVHNNHVHCLQGREHFVIDLHNHVAWNDVDLLINGSNAYRLVYKIGGGGVGTVYHALKCKRYTRFPKWRVCSNNDGSTVAVKQMVKTEQAEISARTEIAVHQRLASIYKSSNTTKHNVSCQMYDYFFTYDYIYLVFEKLGISLGHLLTNNKKLFDLSFVLKIFDEMIVLLYKLHKLDSFIMISILVLY